MTLVYSAKIEIDAEDKTKAVFDSINIDNKFYPENPTKTQMFCNDKITILIESSQVAHMRANLNSCLRLIQTSYDSITSVDI
jgi:KEOPS complex subunit Pcc1